MIEEHEVDSHVEDLIIDVSQLRRDPLCVLEVGNLDAQISLKNSTHRSSDRVGI